MPTAGQVSALMCVGRERLRELVQGFQIFEGAIADTHGPLEIPDGPDDSAPGPVDFPLPLDDEPRPDANLVGEISRNHHARLRVACEGVWRARNASTSARAVR